MPRGIPNKKKPKERTPAKDRPWRVLVFYIQQYRDAAIAESWKGGGDPADIEVTELRLKLTRGELMSHIEKMRREFD